MKQNSTLTLFAVFVLLPLCLLANTPLQEGLDPDLETIRQRLKEKLIQTEVRHDGRIELENPEIQELMETLETSGKWEDIDYDLTVASAWYPNIHLSRMVQMARAYADPESEWYENPELLTKVRAALNFWTSEHPMSRNWYHNDINGPRQIGRTLILLGEEVTPEELEKALKVMSRARIQMTGQNKVWLAANVLMSSILSNDPEKAIEASRAISENITITTEEGLQPDFSYHQHGAQQQFGNYGLSFAQSSVEWMGLLRGTRMAYPEEKTAIIRNYALKGLGLVVWKEMMDISACGRQLFPGSQEDKQETVYDFLEVLSASDLPYRDAYLKLMNSYSEDVTPDEQVTGNKHFWRSDYMVDRRPTYYASVKMHSLRTIGAEAINKENTKGAYIADGALYVYRDGREYEDIFAVWDWQSLPGVTNISHGRTYPSSIFKPRNLAEFVGGVSDGVDGAASMDYFRNELIQNDRSKTEYPITFKKSTFFFEREIVCLGAGISVNLEDQRHQMMTTLNQCLLDGPVHIAADGQSFPIDDRREVSDLSWAWHDGIGYYFPTPTTATIGGKVQKGALSRFFDAGSKDPIEKSVFLCQISHGQPPENASYAYVLLPDMDKEVMSVYAANPRAQILSNTAKLQAAQCGDLTIATFYERGVLELPNGDMLVADQPCMIMVRETEAETEVTVSDPTHKLESVKIAWNGQIINIELPQGGHAGESASLSLSKE